MSRHVLLTRPRPTRFRVRPQRASAARAAAAHAPEAAPAAQPAPEDAPRASAEVAEPRSFAEAVALFDARREPLTATQLREFVHVVRFEPGRIEFRPAPGAPPDLASRLGKALGAWTGRRWVVSISGEPGAPSLAEAERAAAESRRSEAETHPLVRAALELFPGAEITDVRALAGGPGPALDDGNDSEDLA